VPERVGAICVATLATGLLGGLAGCVPASLGPSDPVLDWTAPTYVSPASYTEPNDWIPSETPDELEPIYVAPRHRALQATPTRVQPNRYSGGSSAPARGPAATRPGRARQTATRSHDWPDLDEWQIQAQWINPPPGAGE